MINNEIENGTNLRAGAESPVRKETATSHLVQSSKFARWFAKILLLGLFVSILAMMLLPWQQTSRGSGQVVAYVPQERQQIVEAPVKGRILRIGDGLVEGSKVKKGQFIVEIQPFAENQFSQIEGQIKELNIKLDSTNNQITAYESVVQSLVEAREFSINSAQDLVDAAKAKLEAKRQEIFAYQAKLDQAGYAFNRESRLYQKEVKAKKEVEKKEKEWKVAKAELASVRNQILGLEKEVASKKAKLDEVKLTTQSKIDYNRAMKQDAVGKSATIRKELGDLQIKLDELKLRIITAPRDGTIFRLPIYEQGQAIKVGDPIIILIPESSQKAIELNVPGNDMPLVRIGQEVRLQFEGWPVVQVPGWPSVAYGTFSGVVSTVDATDNGKGEFRLLVRPNPSDRPWPDEPILRQGVRANGWVMLQQVSLGYEIWRQFNGFPVIISDATKEKKGAKPPKLPK